MPEQKKGPLDQQVPNGTVHQVTVTGKTVLVGKSGVSGLEDYVGGREDVPGVEVFRSNLVLLYVNRVLPLTEQPPCASPNGKSLLVTFYRFPVWCCPSKAEETPHPL